MSAPLLADLRESFQAALTAPYASHRWLSTGGHSHWVGLAGWQDSLAGPLSSIARTGGREYVYARDDWYFAEVNDPAGLRARLLEWHDGLTAGVEGFAPATPDEAADLAFMRGLVGDMRRLVEAACELERTRRG